MKEEYFIKYDNNSDIPESSIINKLKDIIQKIKEENKMD